MTNKSHARKKAWLYLFEMDLETVAMLKML